MVYVNIKSSYTNVCLRLKIPVFPRTNPHEQSEPLNCHIFSILLIFLNLVFFSV